MKKPTPISTVYSHAIAVALAIVFAIVLCIAPAHAAPTYYTFSGKVSIVAADKGGYAAAHDIKAGTSVTFIFAVDTSRLAYNRFKGVTETRADSINSGTGYHADYFFDSLITPSLFQGAVTDTASGSFLGYHTVTKIGANTRYSLAFQTIIGNSEHGTQVFINMLDSGAADYMPKVGTAVAATEDFFDSTLANSSVSLTLTCTAVGSTKPTIGVRVPAPAASAWMHAEMRDGTLLLQNHSGRMASPWIRNAAGKNLLVLSLNSETAIPAAALPQGTLFLEVAAPGESERFFRAFSFASRSSR